MRGETVMPQAESGQLARLRLASERAIVVIAWVHGPALLVTGWLTGTGLLPAMALWVGVALAATFAHRTRPGTAGTRATVSAALCVMPALLIMELAGHPWQIDAHMHFFAVLAVTAALLDRQAVILGAAVIAVHHLALSFVLPALVFPGGGDLLRVLLHAVILVFEAAALAWLVDRTAVSISAAEATVELVRLADLREAEGVLSRAAAASAERRQAASAMAAELDRAVGRVIEGLETSVAALGTSADTFSSSASRTSQQAAVSAESSEQARTSVQTVAATIGHMAATIAEITRRVSQAASAAGEALVETQATDATLRQLDENADKIGDVVRLIASIAAQTNLLALNATIEAARAGEHGKGFAVVASEVKILATKTAKATEDIRAQIAHVQDVTARAVAAIREIGLTVERTSGITTAIAAAVEQQGGATREIASAAQRAAIGTERVSAAVAEVNGAVADTATSVTHMRMLTGEIARQGEQLRSEVASLSDRLRRQAEAA